MAEFAYQIKIPKKRIAILIGKDGKIKRRIEQHTKTEINIDSKEGDISVKGEDALLLYATRDIIKAVGRGFNPDVALLLLKQDYAFEMVNLPDFENPEQFRRMKGRVIGREGKTRRLIEEHTDTFISVFGKTVSIIGRTENVPLARRAIEMLLKGSPHSTVYTWLERMGRQLKRRKFEENFDDYLKKPKEEE